MSAPPDQAAVPVPPASRPRLSPAELSLLGCGSIALVAVFLVGVSIFFARRNLVHSTDPQEIAGWLKEELGINPALPKGYAALAGYKGNALGQTLMLAIVGPPGAVAANGQDLVTDDAKTTFQIFRIQMADAAKIDDAARAKLGEKVENLSDRVFKVGSIEAKGAVRELDRNGVKLRECQLALRKNLMFLARGPAAGFDQAAVDDFLLALPLDKGFDLPTRLVPAAPAAKK